MTNGALTEQDATNLLREFVRKNNIYRLRIGNWSAWRILAFPISLELMKIPFNPSGTGSFSNHLSSIRPFIEDSIAFCSAKQSEYFMKTYSSALIDIVDGKYKDIYVDDLILTLGNSYKLEQRVTSSTNERGTYALINKQSNGLFVRYVANALSNLLINSEISDISKQLSYLIARDLNLSSVTYKVIHKHLSKFYICKALYKQLLNKIQPKYVFVPNTCDYELLAASKELGISYIELQHGIMTKYHPDILTKYELKYKDSILCPDKIFVYGEHWKNEIASQGFYKNEIVIVGNSRIDKYRKLKHLHAKKHIKTKHILVTTQGFCTDKIIEFFQVFLRLTPEDDFIITFKLHPMRENNKTDYEEAFCNNRNVKIYLGSETPNTFELLSQSDFHVSISSACHYDAIGIGVPTIILPFQGNDVVKDLIKLNHAVMVKSPEELVSATRYASMTEDSIIDYYFAPFIADKIKNTVI